MSTPGPLPDDTTCQRLETRRLLLIDDLSMVLDLDTGLRAVNLPAAVDVCAGERERIGRNAYRGPP